MVASCASKGVAAPIVNAEGVFGAVTRMLSADGLKQVAYVYATSDGTFWVTGLRPGLGGLGPPEWFARRFSGTGTALSPEVTTSSLPGFSVIPVGAAPDGGLVADILGYPEERGQFLARVSPTGKIALTKGLPEHDLHGPYVDRDGLAHVVGRATYTQVAMTARGLPVIRTLVYKRPFGPQESVPGYLRWGGQLAFLSDERRRLLVATRMMGRDGPRFRLCRVDTKTLALYDSGSINVYQDTFRTLRGPVFQMPKPLIVPADGSGYWLFVPNADTPPSANIWAYRLGPDLKVIRPPKADTVAPRPFSDAPSSAVVRIQCFHRTRERRENGVWVVPSTLALDFVAFGRDGQVYTQTLRDSFTNRVKE
jgi:hypothetical protein